MSTTTTAIDDFLAAACGDHRAQPWTDDAVRDAGRITHDGMWCGGRWPAQLLAQMEAARDAG